PTNPEMVVLEGKINVLKKQVADQHILAVGDAKRSKKRIIQDDVRSNMVTLLTSAESDISALQRKLATLRHQKNDLESELQGVPAQQLEYTRFLLEKKNKEEVLTKLREKLAEVQIQEAASRKRVQV